MDNDVAIYAFIARLLIGGVFVAGGVEHFFAFKPLVEEARKKNIPMPATFVVVGSCWQIVAGLCLIFNLYRPWPALALLVFTVLASVTLLDFWRAEGPQREGMRHAFTVNIALIGGLILAALS